MSEMHFGASKEIFSKAKELRRNMTLAENKLWAYLNNNQLGYKFRRQHPIGRYIADFYCHKKKLIIELDGGIHFIPENSEYDKGRSFDLSELGITVIRFKNEQVLNEPSLVLKEIEEVLKNRI